jgi:uncharacterized membrane protein (UPF0127 family)
MRRIITGCLSLALLALTPGVVLAQESEPSHAEPPAHEETTPHESVRIGGRTFRLELAADRKSRLRGLMGRERVDENGGMLFIFKYGRARAFWMADCLIDLDLIFLDRQGRIIALHEMKAEPPQQPGETRAAYARRLRRYPSRSVAWFAIELKAGSIQRLALKPGTQVELDARRLKSLVH